MWIGAPFELVRAAPLNARCTKIADGDSPNSLSFVPKGTVDPNVEALVGYVGASDVGALGSGGLESSGDIVSVIDGPT